MKIARDNEPRSTSRLSTRLHILSLFHLLEPTLPYQTLPIAQVAFLEDNSAFFSHMLLCLD